MLTFAPAGAGRMGAPVDSVLFHGTAVMRSAFDGLLQLVRDVTLIGILRMRETVCRNIGAEMR